MNNKEHLQVLNALRKRQSQTLSARYKIGQILLELSGSDAFYVASAVFADAADTLISGLGSYANADTTDAIKLVEKTTAMTVECSSVLEFLNIEDIEEVVPCT